MHVNRMAEEEETGLEGVTRQLFEPGTGALP